MFKNLPKEFREKYSDCTGIINESAATIALIDGIKVQKKQPINITRGDIKRIQERSRKITDGKYSISEKKAISVLRGNINLLEAIELDKHNKKPKHL